MEISNFVTISHTGFHLQRYAYKSWSRAVEQRFIKSSDRNEVIFSGIEDKSIFVKSIFVIFDKSIFC